MKKILYKSFLVVSISLFTFSCFETDDGDIDTICNVDSYIDNYLNAVNAYTANPSYSTCVTLKNRAMDLLNAIRNCDYYEDSGYWEDAVAAWNNVDCTNFL